MKYPMKNTNKLRKVLVFVYMAALAALVFYIDSQSSQIIKNDLIGYYLDNFLADTGAKNAVTAIYLNYRVYDTFFEALMLLICVTAILNFSKHERDDYGR